MAWEKTSDPRHTIEEVRAAYAKAKALKLRGPSFIGKVVSKVIDLLEKSAAYLRSKL